MQSIVIVCLAAVLALGGAAGRGRGETKAELVSTAMIWDQAPRNTDADLTRFGNRWFLVCQESTDAFSQDGALRVLSSKDGKTWEGVALIQSPTPMRGLRAPKFTRDPDGRLMISALGMLPYPNFPLPKYGGMIKTMAWFSKDGRAWGGPELIGPDDYPFGRIVWNKGVAFSYAVGRICGSAQTIQIQASKDGKAFESRYKETFSGFMPGGAALLFDGDTAYCVMNRAGAAITEGKPGLLGAAKAPYREWEWKELDRRISRPNLIRLPDKRVIAAVGLFDRKTRTSLCEFHPATGKFTELRELPTGGHAVAAGLAWHDGQLWVSYPAAREGKHSVHLAKVKLR